MKAKILSLRKTFFEGEAESITIPGLTGEIQILNNHADAIFPLKEGNILINGNKKARVGGGFCRNISGEVVVLVNELYDDARK